MHRQKSSVKEPLMQTFLRLLEPDTGGFSVNTNGVVNLLSSDIFVGSVRHKRI